MIDKQSFAADVDKWTRLAVEIRGYEAHRKFISARREFESIPESVRVTVANNVLEHLDDIMVLTEIFPLNPPEISEVNLEKIDTILDDLLGKACKEFAEQADALQDDYKIKGTISVVDFPRLRLLTYGIENFPSSTSVHLYGCRKIGEISELLIGCQIAGAFQPGFVSIDDTDQSYPLTLRLLDPNPPQGYLTLHSGNPEVLGWALKKAVTAEFYNGDLHRVGCHELA
ncbi:hypothetical protein KY320_04470 [Candidatus Woesearchaeota archaeon]|nr:hypothetical protein [Candidatus Woesearchaeota archaeon]